MSPDPLLVTSRCWAEIDSAALIHNVRALPVPPSAVMAVVKSDAYGHGVALVAPILASEGVTHWGVASVGEGLQVREILGAGTEHHNVYLMTAALPENAPQIVAGRITPYCTDFALAQALSKTAIEVGRGATLHVEVDTGIGRAGVQPKDLPAFVAAVRQLPGVEITGICTHFTAADSPDGPTDPLAQHALFANALASLDQEWLSGVDVHAANSPGILRVPDAVAHRLVRPGLLIYGIGPSGQLADGSEAPFPYIPVMSLKARAMLVRRLAAGTDISYSRTFRLPADASVATIGIGYGDGFPRRLSNIGNVLLPDGARAPMRGRVCMDQVCVELPPNTVVKVGDTVTLIGTAGSNTISALDIADMIDATPHEIPTCLTARVPRVLVNEG